jgi:hypothetical protein
LLSGILLLLLAGSIVWVLEMPLKIEFAWDRMTLAFIPGIAILAAFIYALTKKTRAFANILFCLLISTAVGCHFENEMSYKRDWEDMKDMFWQMSWRMPELKSGTTILGSDIGLDYYSDNSLTAPLNLMYAPDSKSHALDYVFYYSEVRVGTRLYSLDKDQKIHQPYRSFSFTGSTNQVVAVKYNSPACLQVMDRVYANSISLPNLSDMQVKELRLTDLSLIEPDPANQPLAAIFDSEPAVDWCYYFEKADLARQLGDYSGRQPLARKPFKKGWRRAQHPNGCRSWKAMFVWVIGNAWRVFPPRYSMRMEIMPMDYVPL